MHGAYLYIFIVFQVLTLLIVKLCMYQIDNICIKYPKIRLCRGLNYWHFNAHMFDLGAFKHITCTRISHTHQSHFDTSKNRRLYTKKWNQISIIIQKWINIRQIGFGASRWCSCMKKTYEIHVLEIYGSHFCFTLIHFCLQTHRLVIDCLKGDFQFMYTYVHFITDPNGLYVSYHL